jgi:sulfofructose kinase
MTTLGHAYFDIDWPRNRPFQVIGFGLNAVDWMCVVPRYPDHNSKMQMECMYKLGGGQIATAAALCGRYGLKARYIGRVGSDEIGRFSLADIQKEPMDTSCVEMVPDTFNQFSFIIVDRPTGERTIIWDRDPRLAYSVEDLRREWITGGQLLHLDGHDQAASIQAARWAREAGMKTSLDIDKVQPGVEALLEQIDFAIVSANFAQQFSGSRDWRTGIRAVAEAAPGFVAVTLGKEGVGVLWEGELLQVPGISVEAVDTTGAGDVFHGAFAYSLFQNWSVERCLRFSNVAGALACTRYGARGGIPSLGEVMSRIAD